MTDLTQAVRDAIDALKTPMPREVIAEQLQRALETASNKSVTAQYGSGPVQHARKASK